METNNLTNLWFSGLNYWPNYYKALERYTSDFSSQSDHAGELFREVEAVRAGLRTPAENYKLYGKLGELCMSMFHTSMLASMSAMFTFHTNQFIRFQGSVLEGKVIPFLEDEARSLEQLAGFGDEMEKIEGEYGFHLDNTRMYRKCGERDRFWLYRVFPYVNGKVRYDLIDENLKPVLIIPPYVLGPNILCFLPDRGKSYVHSFANKGVPTYIRIAKPIDTTPAVARMTPEEECLDTKYFCEIIAKHHKKMVTLNGYCQGGYGAVMAYLSGELDGLVDAVMTCVAPMDGTHSRGLKKFLDSLPKDCNDLAYGTVNINGVEEASGELMSWVYKIKSLDNQAPFVSMYSDWQMMGNAVRKGVELSPTVAALNRWLRCDRSNIPMAITKISFISYNTPITEDGTLPVTLFGRKLNLNRFKETGCAFAIFYAPGDDLVEPEVALAAQLWATYVEALLGGHVKKATSPDQKEGGPERFHLNLAINTPHFEEVLETAVA